MPYLLKSMTGIDGEVTLPTIGASIGNFQKWSLRRREDGPSGIQGFRLHAVFVYPPNPTLWNQESFTKRIVVTIQDRNRTMFKQYRLDPVPGQEMVLEGRVLQCEGVTMWPLEQ